MHHPGPPLFVATGDEVELAPRDPVPGERYRWTIRASPADSTAAVGDNPVEHLVPDEPGTYVARLDAPDGVHDLTIRVFPGRLAPGGGPGTSGRSGGVDATTAGAAGVSGGEAYADETGAGDGPGGRPRLRLDPSVEDGEAVVRAVPRPNPRGDERASDLTVEFVVDDRDAIPDDAVTRTARELRVPLDAIDDRLRVHAVSVGDDGYSVPDQAEFTAGDAGVETHRPYDPPAWAEDAVIYEIYVRTFTDADEGEFFDRLVEKLDYLDSLGVDVLWLTPVLQNDHAPHGYNITDFFRIASDLGTREDYRAFVEAAHERGFKVLFDFVGNHSAREHRFFRDAQHDVDSEYRDWYEWRTETEPETYFDWPYIANFDFDHLPVRRHLLDAADEWAPLVDGFRCDMAWAVPNSFWRELHDRCKDRDREFLLLDETIPYIPDFQAGLFDMHFDSYTYHLLREVGNGVPADRVLDAVEARAESGFPDHAGFMLYAENHDETRYLVDSGRAAAEAAAGAIFTLPGSPLVYAGQEFGQQGRRDTLAWEHADPTLQDHFRALAAARREVDALSGDAALVRVPYDVASGAPDRVVAFARDAGDDAVAVVLNFGDDPATVSLDAAADDTDLVSGDAVGTDDGRVRVDSVAVLPAELDRS
ncbi:MAG: alpha-amylase MalA [Halarchaeum sp.]